MKGVRVKEAPVLEDETELEVLMNKINARNEQFMADLAREHDRDIETFLETMRYELKEAQRKT